MKSCEQKIIALSQPGVSSLVAYPTADSRPPNSRRGSACRVQSLLANRPSRISSRMLLFAPGLGPSERSLASGSVSNESPTF